MSTTGVIMEQKPVVLTFDEFLDKLRKDREDYGERAQSRIFNVSRFTITRICQTQKGFTVSSLLNMVRGYGGDVKLVFPNGIAIPPRLRRRRIRRLPNQ